MGTATLPIEAVFKSWRSFEAAPRLRPTICSGSSRCLARVSGVQEPAKSPANERTFSIENLVLAPSRDGSRTSLDRPSFQQEVRCRCPEMCPTGHQWTCPYLAGSWSSRYPQARDSAACCSDFRRF